MGRDHRVGAGRAGRDDGGAVLVHLHVEAGRPRGRTQVWLGLAQPLSGYVVKSQAAPQFWTTPLTNE